MLNRIPSRETPTVLLSIHALICSERSCCCPQDTGATITSAHWRSHEKNSFHKPARMAPDASTDANKATRDRFCDSVIASIRGERRGSSSEVISNSRMHVRLVSFISVATTGQFSPRSPWNELHISPATGGES